MAAKHKLEKRDVSRESERADGFRHRGIWIWRTWKSSSRGKDLDEAIRKVTQRGPVQNTAI